MTQNGPVTVVVNHLVKPDKESEFKDWGERIRKAALQFEGHGGYHVIRKSTGDRLEYVALFAFDTAENLAAWNASQTQQELVKELEDLLVEPPTREERTGMEVWFTPPPGWRQAPRYKMVLVTFLGIYPLVLLVLLVVNPLLASWPFLLRTSVSTGAMVCLMTYVVMPLWTRLFKKWLYAPQAGSQ